MALPLAINSERVEQFWPKFIDYQMSAGAESPVPLPCDSGSAKSHHVSDIQVARLLIC